MKGFPTIRRSGRMLKLMLAAIGTMVSSATFAAVQPPHTPAPRFEQAHCPKALVDIGRRVTCGSVRVPEDFREPGARQVILPVAIVKAPRPRPGASPVIFLHGGPGGGSVSYLHLTLKTPFGRELVARDRDWIFFDQRGGTRSKPSLDCGSIALTDAGPQDAMAVSQLQACARRLHRRFGVRFDNFTSEASAFDVQQIRRALHIRAFNLFGVSYGTKVAEAVLTHQSAGLRSVVLDSPWTPEAKWTEPVPGWVSQVIRSVLRECAGQNACRSRYGNVEAELDRLLASWGERGIVVAGKHYDEKTLSSFLFETLYDRDMMRGLPKAISQIAAGNMATLKPYVTPQVDGYVEGQHMAVVCNEEIPFERPDAVLSNAGTDPIALAVARTLVNYFTACASYRGRMPSAVEQMPVHSKVPTLFLAAGLDAACPIELSQRAVKNYEQGQLLVFPHSIHQVAVHSACARSLVRDFLEAPARPTSATCLKNEPPSIDFK